MPNISENNFFSNGSLNLNSLLKFVQENGTKSLWREVDGLDAIIKKSELETGKEIRYHLTVDAGGGAFSGLNSQSGSFAPSDPTYGIQGFAVPKFQTMTMYYERVMNKLTSSAAKAYINSVKLEWEQKTSFQKSFMNLQQLGDGTGRLATPIGIGSSDTATGTSITHTENAPLKIKLSSLDAAIGGAAHLMEGSVVSFVFPDYDTNADGTANTLIAAGPVVRFLNLLATHADATTAIYDSFRVVKVDQENDAVYVFPARYAGAGSVAAAVTYAGALVQRSSWASGAAGVITFTFINGLCVDNATTSTTQANNLSYIFNASALTGGSATTSTTAVYLMHPHFIPSGTVSAGGANSNFSTYTTTARTANAAALLCLGLTWTNATDVSTINPYLMTGVETLLMNQANTVHGINRASVLQHLATIKDNGGRPLTFNTLFAAISEHYNRNRGAKTDWTVLLMNPMVFSSLISLSEVDRRITEGKGIRGEEGAKLIKMGGQTYQLEMNSQMLKNRIYALPQGALEMHGGTLEPVDVDGQREFMSLNTSGRRINAVEAYNTVQCEMLMRNPRQAMAIKNFSINQY